MSAKIVKNLVLELPDGQQAEVKFAGSYHFSEDPVTHRPYVCVALSHEEAYKLYAEMGKLSLTLKPESKSNPELLNKEER